MMTKGEDYEQRWVAILALGSINGNVPGRQPAEAENVAKAITARLSEAKLEKERSYLILALMKIGPPARASIPALEKIAASDPEPSFIDGVRAWAERTALNDALPFSYWAVGFYAEHGRPAAIEVLQSPRVLSVSNNRTVHAALEQLNRRGVRVEPGVIRPLLDRALAHPEPWPWNCVFEPALRALAASDQGAAARVAEDHFDRPDSPFRRAAVDFLREAAGLPLPFAVEPPAGLELTDDERGLLNALSDCSVVYGEVRNGGLSQYFFNSAGGERPRHVAALRAIGFEPGAAAVEEASRLIWPSGASLDRGQRIAQYAALSERKERRLDVLSRLFSSDAPRVRFMLGHRELFARVRKARAEAGMDVERE